MRNKAGPIQRYTGLAALIGAGWGLAEASWMGALTGGVTTMAAGSGIAMLMAEEGTRVSEPGGSARNIQRAGGLLASLFSLGGAWIVGWIWGWTGAIGGFLLALGLTVVAGALKRDRDSQFASEEAHSSRHDGLHRETDPSETGKEESLSDIDRRCQALSKAILRQLGNRHDLQFHNHSISYTPGYGLSAMALTALDKFQAGEPLRKCWVHFLPEAKRLELSGEYGEKSWTIETTPRHYRIGECAGNGLTSYTDPESAAAEIADRINVFMTPADASSEGSLGVQTAPQAPTASLERARGQAEDGTRGEEPEAERSP